MSAFVLVLVAGVAVDTSGSPEMDLPLDLRGTWKGVWLDEAGTEWEASAKDGAVFGERIEFVKVIRAQDITDEGSGQVRVFYPRVEPPALGIYQQRGDCLMICFREARLGRPTAFQGGNGQNLITLRRVKP